MKKTNKQSSKGSGKHPDSQKYLDSKIPRKTETGRWKDRLSPAVICVAAFIIFCYLMLPVRNGYMLHWYDEMSLFESTRFFFRQCLYYPGGLIRYAGSWLTQLMYYPILGSAVLLVFWLLTAWLTKKAFRLPPAAIPLAFIVPVAMMVSIVQIDDAWLSMRSVGYLYSNTISYLFTIAAVCLYRINEKKPYIAASILLLTACCYFIAGFYALFAAFIGIIFMLADSILSKKYIGFVLSVLIIAVILVIPHAYYTYFNATTVDNDYLYLKGLPDFLMESFDLYLWIPFIVATAFLLLLSILSAFRLIPSDRWVMWVSFSALLLSAIWCFKADRKNEQIRATVVMLRHLENNNWEGMTMVMARIKEPPNYTMRFLNNFALVNLGAKGETLDNVKPRNKDPRHAEGFSVTAYVNIPINYYNGDFNESYRWGMEHSVQYGKRVFFLKYMIKDALLKGEIDLAKRYNDILLKTLFYRKWAKEMNRYIEDPSLIETNIEFQSILELAKSQQNKDKEPINE